MGGRKRAVGLTLLALAVPLPAYAITDRALEAVAAGSGPAAIEVLTTLESCGVLDDGVVCKLNVSFGAVPNATAYSAAVTRADGSVIDQGAVEPGGAALWVPYVGAGSYSVRITAYGAPENNDDRDGRGEVIATGSSRAGDDDSDGKPRETEQLAPETEVEGRDPSAGSNPDPDGAATSEVESSAAPDPACAPTATAPPPAPTPPVEPPEDLDPANPDEDADAIPDDQERVIYEQQLAEYESALATQAEVPAPAPAC